MMNRNYDDFSVISHNYMCTRLPLNPKSIYSVFEDAVKISNEKAYRPSKGLEEISSQ